MTINHLNIQNTYAILKYKKYGPYKRGISDTKSKITTKRLAIQKQGNVKVNNKSPNLGGMEGKRSLVKRNNLKTRLEIKTRLNSYKSAKPNRDELKERSTTVANVSTIIQFK